MKNIVYTLYIFLFCVLQSTAQTATQNYVKTTTYRDSTATTDITKARANVTYYDGLGRPIQQIAGKASATGKDIVTHIEYDAFGRQSKEYLPYKVNTSNLAFDPSAQANTLTFYNNATYENTTNPYAEKFFEPSPLNRIRKQAAPGNVWQGNATDDNDRTIKYAYQTNIANEVLKLTATATWNTTNKVYNISFVSNGYYEAGQLYKSMVQNENKDAAIYTGTSSFGKHYLTDEYKDKEGKLVLKKTYLSAYMAGTFVSLPMETYYVYDRFGNLTYVLPPMADGTIAQLNDLCYQYKYDDKNRLVEKKLPGKNWEFIVYDGMDRIVATGPTSSPFGDGSMGWLYNMYDSYGRICLTGWYPATVTAATRKTLQDANTGTVNLLRGTDMVDGISTGYAAASLVPTGFKLLSAKYYDNYTFPGGPTTFPDILTQKVLTEVKGLATGSWTRAVTTESQTLGETAYTFYDKKTRAICVRTNNYLGGYTQNETKFDFAGKVITNISRHKRLNSNATLTVRDDFYYTAQDRLYRIINGINSLPKQLMSYNTYDELGQLVVKRVGGVDFSGAAALQKVDYKYNIRGWLKEINDVTDLALASAPQDLFAFKINYTDTPTNPVNGSVKPLYNGNIAETTWRTASDDIMRRYGYNYDNLNRLLYSWYQLPQAAVNLRNSYNEQVTYDKNGNITYLLRNGESDNETTTIAIDDLTYTYTGNRLTKVQDFTNHPKGFKDSSDNTGDDYTYYDNGNMKTDKNKGITTIRYNHLNLPTEIIFNGNVNTKITYIYDAEGKKLKKTVTNGTIPEVKTDYLSGFQYQNAVLEFFPTSEGYVKSTVSGSTTTYNYVFNYTDHLGNVRVSYAIDPADNVLKIVDENHYYPFGLKHNGYSASQRLFASFNFPPYVVLTPVLNDTDATYKYKYNGMELQDEVIGVSTANPTGFSLGWYDYKARNYDPAIARWMNIDPLAEKSRKSSPYIYALNNPVYFIDPDGMEATPAEDLDMNDPNANIRINVKEDFGAMVDIGYGRMRDSRSISSSVEFSGAEIRMTNQAKERITNQLAKYIVDGTGLDPKENISTLDEDKRDGRVWKLTTGVAPLRILADAGGGVGEGGSFTIGYQYSIDKDAIANYSHIDNKILISSKAFFRDNFYLATVIGHELVHRLDHYTGLYKKLGVEDGRALNYKARAMLEVRAYQMQRWLSGGKFINTIDDEPTYIRYYKEAKELNTNYNFIIKSYPTFFDNLQK